jgi:hypothetical protein
MDTNGNGKNVERNDTRFQALSVPVIETAKPIVDLKKVGLGDGVKGDWNTKNLGSRLAVDAMCAGAAGGLVAPVIYMIDKYVLPLSLEHVPWAARCLIVKAAWRPWSLDRSYGPHQLTPPQSNHRECLRQKRHGALPQSLRINPSHPTTPVPHLQAFCPHLHGIQRHLPLSQHAGHVQVHHQQQIRAKHNLRCIQIRRHERCESQSRHIQRQPIRQILRHSLATPSPADYLRALRGARQFDDLRILQLAAATCAIVAAIRNCRKICL